RRKVVSWTYRPHEQPAVWADEFGDAGVLIEANKPWQRAIKRRGIALKDVYVDVWAPGEVNLPGANPAHRFLRGLAFYQRGSGSKRQQPNPYDRPIEGVVATVDMTTGKVIDVTDTGIRPVAKALSGSAPKSPPLAPLQVTQPGGPGFRIDGTKVSWQGWRFRVGFNPREGLVLYRVGFAQNGRTRQII